MKRKEREKIDDPSSKKKKKEIPCETKDLHAKFDDERYLFFDFDPLPFIPAEQPCIDLFSTITVYGKRRTGKSVWVKWFLQYYKQYFPWAWVFTKTVLNSHYATFIPNKFVLQDFNAGQLQKIMNRQEKALGIHFEQPNIDPRAIVIWDDYSGSDIRFNAALAAYYYTGRHFLTLNFFCGQHITLTPPSIRSNTDLVILFNTDYGNSLEMYWKDFAGKMDKHQFIQMFHKYCGEVEHGFLAIVNDPNVPPEKKFYYGKAEMIDVSLDSIIGCKEFWAGSEKQLEKIADGTLASQIEKIRVLSKPDDGKSLNG